MNSLKKKFLQNFRYSDILLIVLLIFALIDNSILADNTFNFDAYSKRFFCVDCPNVRDIDNMLGHLRNRLVNLEKLFSSPEYSWVKELIFQRNVPRSNETNLNCLSEVVGTLFYFEHTEKNIKIILNKALTEAIKTPTTNPKRIEFAKNLIEYSNKRVPPICYYIIEEYFFRHLKRRTITHSELLFNRQLHDLFLRDLKVFQANFEEKYKIDLESDVSLFFKDLYITSWNFQVLMQIPSDLAFYIVLRHYFINSIILDIFIAAINAHLANLENTATPQEIEAAVLEVGQIVLPVCKYLQEYESIMNKVVMLEYYRTVCSKR